jgi:hypothetical protein
MPESPADRCCKDDECELEECEGVLTWWESFKKVVDDIVFRSNIHKCFGRRDNGPRANTLSLKVTQANVPKQHTTGKGCINKDGVCTA